MRKKTGLRGKGGEEMRREETQRGHAERTGGEDTRRGHIEWTWGDSWRRCRCKFHEYFKPAAEIIFPFLAVSGLCITCRSAQGLSVRAGTL